MTEAPPETPASPASGPTALAFDPLRLVAALLERWRWIVIGSLLVASPLLLLGLVKAKDKHDAQARLIKREPSAAFRAGEVGESFRPRSLSSATLVSSALSDNVLARVSARSEPRLSLGMLRLALSASEIRGTEFLQLTARHTRSAEAASDLVNLWAAEIVAFSRELQARESREIRDYLQQQVDTTDADLKAVNDQIIAFGRRENLIDAEKQTDVFLRQVADLDLRYQTTRIDLQTIEFKLRSLEKELASYGSANDRLATARTELRDARTRYTDQNPIVRGLQAKVEGLEAEAAARPSGLVLADYASTAVGGDLYLELIDLRARVDGTRTQLAGLEEMRTKAQERLDALPDQVAALANLRLVQRGLETSRQLLAARLREATLFADRAPGYYDTFSLASPQSVATTSRWVKIVTFTIGGLVFGAILGLMSVAAAEVWDQRLRSPREAKRLFGVPVLAELPPGADPAPVVGSLWVSWASPAARRGLPAVLWAPRPDEGETTLWASLLAEAARLMPELKTLDLGDTPSPALKAAMRVHPGSLTLAAAATLAAGESGPARWVRLAGDTVEPALSLGRLWGGVTLVIPVDTATLADWRRHADLLREAGVPVHGLVVTGALPWWERRPRA